MRKNEYGEIMRIQEIRLQPVNAFEPHEQWKAQILWRAENNGRWVGDGEIENIPLADDVGGVLTQGKYNDLFRTLGYVADNYYKREHVVEDIE